MQIRLPKKYLPLIVAGAAGLIAIILINSYIQQRTEEAKKRLILEQQNLSTVVVATQDIPAGTALKESMLKEAKIHKKMLQPRAATSIDRVIDKITIAPISMDEQVLLNKVTISGFGQERSSLSTKVPPGKRAITIQVDNISSIGGMIKPGDYVDVIAMVPVPGQTPEGKQATQLALLPLFQNILVLAVGQETGTLISPESRYKKEEKKEVSPLITLSLNPQEANLVAFVQEQSKIRLVLRSPSDSQIQPLQPATWDTVFQYVLPQRKELPAPVKIEVKEKTVEIYRGLSKEKIPLSE